MRKYMQIVEGFIAPARPAFGRKGVAAQPIDPINPALKAAVEIAREYPTAEAYADDNNRIQRMNSDPAHIHQSYEAEQARLIRQWNMWRDAGYIIGQ